MHVPPLLPQLPVYSCLVSLSALEIWFCKQLRSKPHLWDHFCFQLSRTKKIKPWPCFLSSAKLEKPPHFKPQAISVPRPPVSPLLLWKLWEQLISQLALCPTRTNATIKHPMWNVCKQVLHIPGTLAQEAMNNTIRKGNADHQSVIKP